LAIEIAHDKDWWYGLSLIQRLCLRSFKPDGIIADDTFGYDGFIWWDTLPHCIGHKKY
jgi:hypothetical protein